MTKPKGHNGPQTAAVHSHLIRPVLNGVASYPQRERALETLLALKKRFLVLRSSEERLDRLVLWISGYEITPEEQERGYLGNFCELTVEERNGRHAVVATKLERELNDHPRRRRPPRNHPNAGHPLLRNYERGKNFYDSVDEARSQLQKMADEFPKACTLLTVDKLHARVWSRKFKPPLKDHILQVVSLPDGRHRIVVEERLPYQPPPPAESPPDPVREHADLAIRKLQIQEEREVALIQKACRWMPLRAKEQETCSIFLMRPAEQLESAPAVAKDYVFIERGPHLRFFRTLVHTSEWVAVAYRSFHDQYGRMRVDELILTLGPDNEWHEQKGVRISAAGGPHAQPGPVAAATAKSSMEPATSSSETPSTAPAPEVSPSPVIIPEDHIRELAHRKWLDAGSPESGGRDFWFEAEDELRRRLK